MNELLKYGIEVYQRLQNGLLGGPHQSSFSMTFNSVLYNIVIEQSGIRKISLTTELAVEVDDLIMLFNELDMLIMLGGGQFVPVVKAKLIMDDTFVESDELKERFANRAKMFRSADFTTGKLSAFVSFDQYMGERIFSRWIAISKELDILHCMVLYSMADTGMTIDCKSAFLIESFEALSEAVEMYDFSFKSPCVKRGESRLGKYLYALIIKYGGDIFSKELSVDIQKIIKIFVNSRNRIAHIKSKQDKTYLCEAECVLYAVKMSYLYRTILLRLLGVDYSLFSNAIIESISYWDKWNGISDTFLQRI